jgi:hypothetical protein
MPSPSGERDEFIQLIEFISEYPNKKEKIGKEDEGLAWYFLPICGRG